MLKIIQLFSIIGQSFQPRLVTSVAVKLEKVVHSLFAVVNELLDGGVKLRVIICAVQETVANKLRVGRRFRFLRRGFKKQVVSMLQEIVDLVVECQCLHF